MAYKNVQLDNTRERQIPRNEHPEDQGETVIKRRCKLMGFILKHGRVLLTILEGQLGGRPRLSYIGQILKNAGEYEETGTEQKHMEYSCHCCCKPVYRLMT